MTAVDNKLRVAFNTILAVGSIFLFVGGLGLLAEWRVDVLDGIFMLNAGLLGALVFMYRAKEMKDTWPISIIQAR